MSPPDTPLNRIAARFGYQLDDTALPTSANLPAVEVAAAGLCATVIAHVEAVTDPDLRYALSRDREAARLTGVLDDTAAAIEHAYRADAALLDTAVSAGVARQRGANGASVPTDPDTWVPGVVRVAGSHGGPYPCQVMRHRRWNGWAIPRFTHEVAVRLLADLSDEWHRHDQHPGYLRGGLRSSVGDAVLVRDDENFDFVGSRCTVCGATGYDIADQQVPSMAGYGHDHTTNCRVCGSSETTGPIYDWQARRAVWPPSSAAAACEHPATPNR